MDVVGFRASDKLIVSKLRTRPIALFTCCSERDFIKPHFQKVEMKTTHVSLFTLSQSFSWLLRDGNQYIQISPRRTILGQRKDPVLQVRTQTHHSLAVGTCFLPLVLSQHRRFLRFCLPPSQKQLIHRVCLDADLPMLMTTRSMGRRHSLPCKAVWVHLALGIRA